MVDKSFYSFDELLGMIEEPNQSRCGKMFEDYRRMFEFAPGSKSKHQGWEGGYLDHLWETMNLAVITYGSWNAGFREMDFSLSDALLVLYLHDLEKPWKYAGGHKERRELETFEYYQDFIFYKADEYGIELTEGHRNALKYVHGEGEDYDPYKNVMGPLATFVHCCDNASARIWPDYPESENRGQTL